MDVHQCLQYTEERLPELYNLFTARWRDFISQVVLQRPFIGVLKKYVVTITSSEATLKAYYVFVRMELPESFYFALVVTFNVSAEICFEDKSVC